MMFSCEKKNLPGMRRCMNRAHHALGDRGAGRATPHPLSFVFVLDFVWRCFFVDDELPCTPREQLQNG